METSIDEQSAITLMKQGNIAGLEFLVDRYQVSAIHSAFLIVQDRSLAEDIVSAAFIKSYQKAHQIKAGKSFRPWFFRIVINDSIKSAKARQRFIRLETEGNDDFIDLANWIITPDLPLEDEVILNEDKDALRKAITFLSPEERAIVVMRFYLDMSEEESALKIGKPLSTIKFRFRSAKKRLGLILSSENRLKSK